MVQSLADLFQRSQREQLDLCAALEKIADSLPEEVDRQTCIQVARAINPIIERAHKAEEDHIFPALRQKGKVELDASTVIGQLCFDHVGDTYMAEEVVEVLMSYGTGKPHLSAETTGYVLRGFFSGLRRHIALEAELFGAALSEVDSGAAPQISRAVN